MAINTGSFAAALYPGVNRWYGDGYKEFKTEYTDIFTVESSRRAWEEEVSYMGFGYAQVKGEGASVAYDTAQQGFVDRYTHVTYGLGFIITREMVDDDLYDVIAPKKAKSLAFSMRQTKEVNCANVLNRAFNSTYTYGDGVELCANDHPTVIGGTWSNIPTAHVDLSEAALEQAVIDMGKWPNERGMRIAVRPQKLIVPVDLVFEADKLMKTEYEVGTNNNTINAVKSKFPGGVVVNHYLTDTDAWFIKTDVPNGLILKERRGDDFTMDGDFDTDNAKFKATARYSVGCTDKRGIWGTSGA